MSKDRKEKWYAVLFSSFMSSEESAEDEGDNPPILHVKNSMETKSGFKGFCNVR